MKIVQKALIYLVITIVIVIGATVVGVVVYKQEIINLLVEEVNKKIKTELEVENIDLKLIKGFPNLSVNFKGVKFHSAFKDDILLKSENVYFVLNVMDLFSKNVVVEQLEISNAQLNISIDSQGNQNFDVFVANDSLDATLRSFNLNSIVLRNVKINDSDKVNNIKDGYHIQLLKGSFYLDEEIIELKVVGNLKLSKTNQQQLEWLVGKKIALNTSNSIKGDEIQIHPSDVAIGKVELNLKGSIGIGQDKIIDLALQSTDLNFKDLQSILPQHIQQMLSPYNGSGVININTTLKGSIGGNRWPSLTSSITLKEFEIKHNMLPSPLERINLTGVLSIKNLKDLSSGVFKIESLKASVEEKEVNLSGVWKNFIAPEVSVSAHGTFNMPWVLSFVNSSALNIEGSEGEFEADITAKIKLDKTYSLKNTDFDGKLVCKKISVNNMYGLPLSSLNGELNFNNQAIILKQISLNYGQTNLLINGEVILPQENNKRILSKLEIKSELVDMDQIMKVLTSSEDSSSTSDPLINKYSVKLDLALNRLNFMKFRGKDVIVNLIVDENVINVSSASAKAMGGEIGLKGSMSSQFNGDYYLEATTQTKQINIDSLFYVFGNFNQTFITSKAIDGKLDANVYAQMYFDHHWNFKQELLYSEAMLRVREGKLINFEPVMSLATYLNEEGENLADLKFSDIENHIIISDDTVFVSDMYVGTNVRNIKIGGYHTLAQHIDYRMAVPVINDKKDADTKFGKVKTDNRGQLYFPFRVYGTTSDYKVVYDLKTASSNFVKGVKREIKGIGDVLVGKPKEVITQDSLQLEDDEFFDWDNN